MNKKIELEDCVFLFGAGASLTKDIDYFKNEIYVQKDKFKILSCDTVYTHLLKNDIESDFVFSVDFKYRKLEKMESVFPIEPRNSILLSHPEANRILWHKWDDNQKLSVKAYKWRNSVVTAMISFADIEYPEKYKICLGYDLCWQDDSFYVDNINKGWDKIYKNLGRDSNIREIKDIYDNNVYTDDFLVGAAVWIESHYGGELFKIINASSGPTILGFSNEHIKKIKLKNLF